MQRLRIVLGLLAGTLLILSSAMHSLLGWKQLNAALTAAQAPPDLIQSLGLGWQFAGVAMLGFGCIVIMLCIASHGNPAQSLRPLLVVAIVYLAFGGWALVVSKFEPFFMVFIVPGLILLFVATAPRAARRS